MKQPQKYTWKEAIIKVLSANMANGELKPMHYKDICDAITENKLVETNGKTPVSTVNAQLCTNKDIFIPLGNGIYGLKNAGDMKADINPETPKTAVLESTKNLINAFGMFWKRESINWEKPKLLGMQSKDAEAINFNSMRGIYLLYDGREVIYVGQAVKQPIIKRLIEHTRDRLATRWNRFSWFGIDNVDEKGKIVSKKFINTSIESLADAFEGILIEGMEPRQNRKSGDNFGIEYLQHIDKELSKHKLIAEIIKAVK